MNLLDGVNGDLVATELGRCLWHRGDGCMVRRQSDEAFCAILLTECEAAVLATTGYKISLAEKCLHCGVAVAKCVCTECPEAPDPSELFGGLEPPAKKKRVE